MNAHKVYKNYYRDSVTLMRISSEISAMDGVKLASALMGTPANLQMMRDAGLFEEAPSALANDLVFVVKSENEETSLKAFAELERLLNEDGGNGKRSGKAAVSYPSISAACRAKDFNFALISVPGEYAAMEALKALKHGLNVMLFSDNVSVEDEAALKRYASSQGLIVMGPDCGTAVISGAPLAFANVLNKGHIGVVGASGTGIQEITTLIDRLGEGISHAIGTGGHDLSLAVGGISMKTGLKILKEDEDTKVIVLVSKPPAKRIEEEILSLASEAGKPVVVCFLGASVKDNGGIVGADTLEDAAYKAVSAFRKSGITPPETPKPDVAKSGYLRALYSGGTFCYEAQLELAKYLEELYSNVPAGRVEKLESALKSRAHTIIDLGDDEFTRGKPHPMIDPRERNARILEEAKDPDCAVILLDVMLGHGAHSDPAGEVVKTLAKLPQSPRPIFTAFVCGTEKDPQNIAAQKETLLKAGVRVLSSNIQAVRFTLKILGYAL